MNVVLYSSLTGNTKKVGETIAKSLGFKAISVKDVTDISKFDKIIFGFYVDKGLMDPEAKRVAKLIENKNMGLYMTLGASPKGEHAKSCFEKIVKFFQRQGNTITHTFMCQGAIDPKLIEMMRNMSTHNSPEHEKRWEEAKTHPDENDLKDAIKAFEGF